MTTRTFIPTDEQEAIANGFLEALEKNFPPENIAIDAGAGTGKSATLLYLLEKLKQIGYTKSVMMLAFNRSIKDELNEKIKKRGFDKASAKTFNGLGFAAFLRHYKIQDANREVWIDTKKYKRIARYLVERHLPISERTPEQVAEAGDMLARLFEFFRVNTTRHNKTNNLMIFMGGSIYDEEALVPYDPTNVEVISQIAFRYNLFLDKEEDERVVYRLIPEMFKLGKLAYEKPAEAKSFFSEARFADRLDGLKRWCDFGDQVHGCVVEQWLCYGVSIIMVDEAQDTSPLDRALVDMHRWGKNGKKFGRVVLVGDPAQAIYAFRGADGDGFYNSMRFWFIKKAYPLSLSYRVPQVVAARAAEHKKGYRAHESNIEGEIAEINERDLIQLAQDGDLVVSRVRSALIVYRNLLLQAGKPARILGNDMTESIVSLLTTVSEMEGYRWQKTVEFIQKYRDHKLMVMEERKKSEEDIARFLDNIDTVIAIVQALPDNITSLDDAIAQIERDFDPANQPEGGVIVATGHVTKGMEFKRVFNVTPDKFPMVWQGQQQSEYIQELNLAYVVLTRTIEQYFEVKKDAPSYFDRDDEPNPLKLEVVSPTGEKTLVPIPNVELPPQQEVPMITPVTESSTLEVLPPAPEKNWAQKLMDTGFVILDFETTSLDGEPCQIAVIDHTGEVLLNTLIRPKLDRISKEASAVHGITDDMVADSLTFTELHRQLNKLLTNKTVIAYNSQFDKGVYQSTCRLYRLPPAEGATWDCAMLAYMKFKGVGRRQKLVDACAQMGVKVDGEAHDALVDVRMTLGLIKAMAGIKDEQPVIVEQPAKVETEPHLQLVPKMHEQLEAIGKINVRPIKPRELPPQRRQRLQQQASQLTTLEDLDALLLVLLEQRAKLVEST